MKVVILTAGAAPDLFPAVDPLVVQTVAALEAHRDADLYVDLDFERVLTQGGAGAAAARAAALTVLLPSPVIVNALLPTIAEIGQPFIRLNGWPGLLTRDIHELAFPDADSIQRAAPLYERLGRRFQQAPDLPGMITARILSTIINEAWYTWEQGVSSKEEIDTAMRLGTNYPMGPFAWGAQIGLEKVFSLLEALSRDDTRYLPAKSLENAVRKIKI